MNELQLALESLVDDGYDGFAMESQRSRDKAAGKLEKLSNKPARKFEQESKAVGALIKTYSKDANKAKKKGDTAMLQKITGEAVKALSNYKANISAIPAEEIDNYALEKGWTIGKGVFAFLFTPMIISIPYIISLKNNYDTAKALTKDDLMKVVDANIKAFQELGTAEMNVD